jgi:hypothetical protein
MSDTTAPTTTPVPVDLSAFSALANLAKFLPKFDGSRLLRAKPWLEGIEARFASIPQLASLQVGAALITLSGVALEKLGDHSGSNWAEFRAKVLRKFDPDVEKSLLLEKINNGTRYKGLEPYDALDLAIEDAENCSSDQKVSILKAVSVVFPASLLASQNFSPSRPFGEMIAMLREMVQHAKNRSSEVDSWALSPGLRAFAAVPSGSSVGRRAPEATGHGPHRNGTGGKRKPFGQRMRESREADKRRIAELEAKLEAAQGKSETPF